LVRSFGGCSPTLWGIVVALNSRYEPEKQYGENWDANPNDVLRPLPACNLLRLVHLPSGLLDYFGKRIPESKFDGLAASRTGDGGSTYLAVTNRTRNNARRVHGLYASEA